ncbi:hypothetical protein NLI96_g12381 [Meripilus lineatus]|uniref:Uncharacterized protein n=1 Tax=Meripilus lineatus TaxID=2056292 RepID=A0AAD5YCH1_9APHY|nr:hypothetical protein NLI96_g12381 [Physisporinus lineatus]
MSKANETAFLSHIISQTQANISFLVANNYLSSTDASDMISRLAEAQAKGIANRSTSTIGNSISNLSITPPPQPSVTPPPARRNVPPPPPRYIRARALWAYNEDGRVCTFVQRLSASDSCYLTTGAKRPFILSRRDCRNRRGDKR